MTIDERISSELRRDLPNVDEHGAWDQIQKLAVKRRNRSAITLVAVPAAALLLLLIGLRLTGVVSDATDPASQPANPFVGIWINNSDADGSTQTMTVQASKDGAVEIVVLDDYASVCSGVPSTMTGTGRLVGVTELLIPAPVYTCDDGSEPEALSGPPLHEQLLDLTVIYQLETDGLTDNLGSVWTRQAAEGSNPGPRISGSMWPQSSLDEVKEAQRLADAGDPDYTWQLDSELTQGPRRAEIFVRFLREQLGWEQFSGGDGGLMNDDGTWISVDFIRCAPDVTNPLYPNHPCAPTIDEFRYETVSIEVAQLGQRGAAGIWVVSRWEMLLQSKYDPGSLFGVLFPDFSERQVEQVAPPSDAEVTALLQAFLRARVDGEGAEQYLLHEPEESWDVDKEVPLLYATTSGDPYEQSEVERLQGPEWPSGWMEYKVRLFAEGETVVEQHFHVVRHDGQLGLVYGHTWDDLPTTENGQSVAVPFSFLDGEVTFSAAPPWSDWAESPTSMTFSGGRNWFVIAADPLSVGTGCENGSAPADAEALARSITADPDFETTEPVPVRIAGIDGVQIDVVVAADGYLCYWDQWALEMMRTGDAGWRMRLYLIDYPGESAKVLAIAVIEQPDGFEQAIAETIPIIESIEFHVP